MRIERHRPDGRVEGRIVQILERRAQTIVGRYDIDAAGLGYVVPFDRRLLADVHIPSGDTRDAEPGEMVTVEVTRWPTPTRGPVGRIIEVLGGIDEPGVDTEIILRKHGIPDEHAAEAVEEARRLGTEVKERDLRNRTDFRDRMVVTIDGEDARDFDDAISIERLQEWQHLARRAHRGCRALRDRGRSARRRSVRAEHVGLFSRACRPHVSRSARDRLVQPSTRTSIGWCNRA